MKIRTFGRHVKDSIKSVFRNGWMTFASVSAVTVTLILLGVFFVILMNINAVATSIQEDVSIKVLIDTTADSNQQKELESQIRSISEVDTITFSSKDQELDVLMSDFGEQGSIFGLYKQDNPLYDAFIVEAKDPRETSYVANRIESLENVYDVNYGQAEVDRLFQVIEVGRNTGIALLIGLFLTAIFLISNTIRITIVARQKEIEIMRLVGATNWFIRWPLFLEGLWLGILGSIIPITFVLVTYKNIYDYLAPQLEGSFINILAFDPFAYQVSVLLLLMGGVIGIWGSLMSVHKFLKV
ncbi:permease-like cell division protein FtsX [Caldifermentibacillus hisashii]|uniref:permease-like cell division protein FtsX n=1 Tax=Caldifermentibacillus hisashii TaxID=996558 RepID=UPI003D2127F4